MTTARPVPRAMTAARRSNMRKLAALSALVLAAAVLYMGVDVNFANEKLMRYSARRSCSSRSSTTRSSPPACSA